MFNSQGEQWDGAASRPAEELSGDMEVMLTHPGISTFVDIASEPNNMVVRRRRIQNGELAGSNIYTSGFGLFPRRPSSLLLKGRLWKRECQQLDGIQVSSIPSHSHVEVRARDATGSAGKTDLSAFLQSLSYVSVYLGQVHVDGEEAISVVDDHTLAFVEQLRR
jgi:hypothetical protein